jgi:hypothetical protein
MPETIQAKRFALALKAAGKDPTDIGEAFAEWDPVSSSRRN